MITETILFAVGLVTGAVSVAALAQTKIQRLTKLNVLAFYITKKWILVAYKKANSVERPLIAGGWKSIDDMQSQFLDEFSTEVGILINTGDIKSKHLE